MAAALAATGTEGGVGGGASGAAELLEPLNGGDAPLQVASVVPLPPGDNQ